VLIALPLLRADRVDLDDVGTFFSNFAHRVASEISPSSPAIAAASFAYVRSAVFGDLLARSNNVTVTFGLTPSLSICANNSLFADSDFAAAS